MRTRPPAAGTGPFERAYCALACAAAIAAASRGARSAPEAARACVLATDWATQARRGPGDVRGGARGAEPRGAERAGGGEGLRARDRLGDGVAAGAGERSRRAVGIVPLE